MMSLIEISLHLTAREAGWHLFLSAVCAHCWQTDRGCSGGQEPEEDGCRWPFRWVQLLSHTVSWTLAQRLCHYVTVQDSVSFCQLSAWHFNCVFKYKVKSKWLLFAVYWTFRQNKFACFFVVFLCFIHQSFTTHIVWYKKKLSSHSRRKKTLTFIQKKLSKYMKFTCWYLYGVVM